MNNKLNLMMITVIFFTAFYTIPISCLYAESLTILERVRQVEDPELGLLIEIAKENYSLTPYPSHLTDDEKTRIDLENKVGLAKVVRIVTKQYAQIVLLDKKIELLEKKIDIEQKQEIESEYRMTKTTLESERLKCIAELREALNIDPWIPFGP